MGKDVITTLKVAALLLAIFVAYLFKGALVEPPAVNPDHPFNTARAFERLERVLGDELPHPVDSDAGDAVRERLLSEIQALGFSPIVGDDFHCVDGWHRVACARLRNISFWVTEPDPDAVLLLSHYDSVAAGPGASDDGAGVAASLEIASLMKGKELDRPLMVLITDGEEAGLMGASLFVEKDPRAAMIGAVVNMEARGTSGLPSFFQSSRPNGRDLKALGGSTRLPSSSSMSADIYELLPNDTDLTEFLGLPIDATNFAYSGDVAYYHTPGDNLARMDQRSLFTMGAAGLTATEAFLEQSQGRTESQYLFVDVMGWFILKIPPVIGLFFIGACFIAAAFLLWSMRAGTTPWRVALVPPLSLIVGVALAVGGTLLITAFRPEVQFGAAYPIALRAMHASAGLLGAMIIYTFFTRPADRVALLASSWFWFGALGLLIFATVQGAAILFAPSSLLFAGAAIALVLDRKSIGLALAILGATIFAIIILPLSAMGEESLFIESAAPFAIVAILLLQFTIPLIWPAKPNVGLRSFWLCLLGTGSAAAVTLVAAFMVPAYSADAPRGLSVHHVQGYGYDTPVWSVVGLDPVPSEMNAVAAFTPEDTDNPTRQLAQAPPFATSGVKLETITDVTIQDQREIRVRILAPEADKLILVRDDLETKLASAAINGTAFSETGLSTNSFLCAGRSCRAIELTLRFAATDPAPNMDVYAIQFGLGPESEDLLEARPDWTIPRQDGDYRLLKARFQLEPKAEQNE